MDASRAEGATPAMAQWFRAKADYPDALIFFRMGDFYELFFDDAEAASAALDIALTARGTHRGQPVSMCGVPVSQRDLYLGRLIRRGFRVAVAEQLETPEAARARTGKSLIERAVTRLITPGTITEEALLEAGGSNILLALVADGDRLGAAWLDVSTAMFETAAIAADALAALLGRLEPAEILATGLALPGPYAARRTDADAPPPDAARRFLAHAFGVAAVDAFGSFTDAEASAAAAALRYVERSQAGVLPRLARPVRTADRGLLEMDAATRASLDLLRTRDGAEAGSLLGAVKRTVSAAGARMLAGWIAAPLDAIEPLQARQAGWQSLLAEPEALRTLRASLRGAPDLARALARLSLAARNAGRLAPRDLGQVRDALASAEAVRKGLAPLTDGNGTHPLAGDCAALAPPDDLARLLESALVETPPPRTGEGPAIRPGFDGELDAERRLRDETRQVIAGLQVELASRYGVASLKVRHHSQLGYVLEAPSGAVEALRAFPELILRQGLASAARFTHPELSDLDRRIAEAHERAAAREALVLDHLLRETIRHEDRLGACAQALARLDAIQSAASLAGSGRWCAPVLTGGMDFAVEAGRHPVVEAALPPGASYIANDADLSPDRRLMLLTGPNMAGKSTFLRQNALMIVLAQAGLPVPADAARIGLVDRLFSRVGAADDLAAGRSTFMVEMIETAAILHQAGPRGFVIIDEIGRGTGTRDGLAIAQAVLEALHGMIRCRAIFATHFHDLVQLGAALPRLRTCTMRVKEWRGEVVFLHEVIEGAAERSWGVHVAKLAGVPEAIVRRADALLRAAERTRGPAGALPLFAGMEEDAPASTDVAAATDAAEWRTALAGADPDRLTPRAALDLIYSWRRKFLGDAEPDAVNDE